MEKRRRGHLQDEALGAHADDKVIKHIGEMDEDDSLEEEDDIQSMMIELKVDLDLIDEVQGRLYDQFTFLLMCK